MVDNVGKSELFICQAVEDTVNLCQQLEVVVKPDKVLIDQAAYSTLVGKIIADPLQPILLKEKIPPMTIYSHNLLK